ncbi:YVTN repeat-like/Quino protein amine dehydrogenase [Coemansia reversa NRRL 1564]|uniref:YVTN repeat-like/Quino protein amine dehydrogenase n=1 Tax=Coemansia reversa (strain ATCC 12441 / NRRL 1564) TaxID=763665 RepID=A0A2G5BDK8_COERN|nr:YVTN repeat-like/Quino protein amine dehydrogenase [Coemansia reversa NRRL 1564]|eukprot:PIA17099.1 YVTN repeat-like/Quino protein amine dehydrogenase [Coemansia reversa NRRL 1564]
MPMAVQEKRARAESKPTKVQAGSRLFEPYRALGYIASNTAHSIQYRGQSAFVTVGIGRSFHVYDAEKIDLLFVGPQFDADVVSLLSIGDETFVSSGGQIIVCKRGKLIGELEQVNRGEINNLMQFGDHIIGISEDNAVVIWDKNNREIFTEIEFQSESFRVTSVVHPSTYVNKIVVGSAQGAMQVWNIQTRKCLYEFKSFGSGITCMVQAPVIDVLALGLLDGRILLHNIKLDRPVMQLAQEGRVTAASFRTDDVPMMATANAEGDVALWDLDKKRLMHVLQGAHDSSIPSIDFLTGQPLLLTSSADNSIKEWLFEGNEGIPRLLRHRSGHFASPQMIRYYGDDGRTILSAGRDRTLRFFSVFRDSQSTEMSQGSLGRESRARRISVNDLRLPQTIQFASNSAKTKDWDDVISCQQGSKSAHTWSVDRKALGKYTFESSDGTVVNAVAISACGNFGLLGLSSGVIEMVNMQSGMARRTFAGHSKAVTGIQTDSCNLHIYSTSLDGSLRIWDFATGKQLHCIALPSAPSRLVMHGEGGLLACACDDACVRVVDVESSRVVRKFTGHRNRITDLAFSNDGRWIVTGSLDSTIRTWDLPTGHMVDWFRVESVPVSLAFSPSGDFLATAHMDSVGIFLWANRTQFSDVSLRQINPATDGSDEEGTGAALVTMPTSAGLADDSTEQNDAMDVEEYSDRGVYLAPEQLTDNMVTLSSLPKSKWQTLLNLATIKKRNMPEKAPRVPEQAPFFLPTVEGVEHRFDLDDNRQSGADSTADAASEKSKILNVTSENALTRILYGTQDELEFEAVFNYLMKLNPSAIDFEIRTLPVDDDLRAIKAFIRATIAQLHSKRNFELTQAYLQVFLNVFGDIIRENAAELENILKELRKESRAQWNTVDGLIRYSACMVEFMRGSK